MEKSVDVSASCVSVYCCGIQAVNHPGDPAFESFTSLVTVAIWRFVECRKLLTVTSTFGCQGCQHPLLAVIWQLLCMVYMVTWCTWWHGVHGDMVYTVYIQFKSGVHGWPHSVLLTHWHYVSTHVWLLWSTCTSQCCHSCSLIHVVVSPPPSLSDAHTHTHTHTHTSGRSETSDG